MRMLFEYFNKKFDHNPNESVNKEDTGSNIKHLKLFDLVIKSFENSILPTYNTHYVQFILFYICSFKVSQRILYRNLFSYIILILIIFNVLFNILAFICRDVSNESME